jgi:hypothetical protein
MFDEPGFPREERGDPSLPLLRQVVYCSRAAESVDDAEVTRIVATSKRRNPERGITGLLVYGSGIFFQWIEGPHAQIAQLMEILHADPRHRDIVWLSQTEEVGERMFPDWDMEQVAAQDIRVVLEDARSTTEDPDNIAALTGILAGLDAGPLSSLGG